MIYKKACIVLLSAVTCTQATLHKYEFNITEGVVNPDCHDQGYTVPLINGQFPGPPILVNQGDDLEILVRNQLKAMNTSIHYHGIRQIGTVEADGVPGVTQYSILPGQTYLQKFKVENQAGTYFYHAHVGLQDDTVKGAFIVYESEKANPSSKGKEVASKSLLTAGPYTYKNELTLQLGEWWHDDLPSREDYYLGSSFVFDHGADSILMNGRTVFDPEKKGLTEKNCQGYTTLDVEPNATYRLRVIGSNTFRTLALAIKNHNMTLIEIDGELTQPYNTSFLEIAPGQRYSVLLNTGNHPPGTTFAIGTSYLWRQRGHGMTENGFGYIRYTSPKDKPVTHLFKPVQRWSNPRTLQSFAAVKDNKKQVEKKKPAVAATTKKPAATTTKKPAATTKKPSTTSKQKPAATTTKKPSTTSKQKQVASTTKKPATTSKQKPVVATATSKLPVTTKKPVSGTNKPTSSTSRTASSSSTTPASTSKPPSSSPQVPNQAQAGKPVTSKHSSTLKPAETAKPVSHKVDNPASHNTTTKVSETTNNPVAVGGGGGGRGGRGGGGRGKKTEHVYVDLPTFPNIDEPDWFYHQIKPLAPRNPILDETNVRTIKLVTMHQKMADNTSRYLVNQRLTMDRSNVPTLMLHEKTRATAPVEYNPSLDTYPVGYNETLDLVFQNMKNEVGGCLLHPWHTHGHSHYVIASGQGDYVHQRDKDIRNFKYPLFRDTTIAYPSVPTNDTEGCGWTKIRLLADNPGFWAVHCHISTHMIQGKMIVLEEAPHLIEKHKRYK